MGNYAPQAGNTVPASQKRLGQQNAGHPEKNRNITLSTLEKLCLMLDCTPNDVVQFIPDDKK